MKMEASGFSEVSVPLVVTALSVSCLTVFLSRSTKLRFSYGGPSGSVWECVCVHERKCPSGALCSSWSCETHLCAAWMGKATALRGSRALESVRVTQTSWQNGHVVWNRKVLYRDLYNPPVIPFLSQFQNHLRLGFPRSFRFSTSLLYQWTFDTVSSTCPSYLVIFLLT
jgi:hypothetical protein